MYVTIIFVCTIRTILKLREWRETLNTPAIVKLILQAIIVLLYSHVLSRVYLGAKATSREGHGPTSGRAAIGGLVAPSISVLWGYGPGRAGPGWDGTGRAI